MIEMYESSGNIFEDLACEDAENLKVRSSLMIQLKQYVQQKALTQKAAAELFGITQPRMSDLMRGKIDLFSVDTLINMLSSAGLHVSVQVHSLPIAA